MTVERVFVVGATGNIGEIVVKGLLSRKIPVTIYARNPAKALSLFPDTVINIIKGDFDDISPIETSIAGHSRLFLLTCAFGFDMKYIKGTIAKWAYAAGVKQIAILEVPSRGSIVTLRPGRLMHNMYTFDHLTPDNTFRDTEDENLPQAWVSTRDVADVAVAILTEDIQRHGDSVYELVGDFLTRKQRAEALSRALGKEVKYQKITALEKYNDFLKHNIPHFVAYSFVNEPVAMPQESKVSIGLPILLGRNPETFEEFASANKDRLS